MKNAYSEIETATRYDSARSLPPQTKTLWLDALQFATWAGDQEHFGLGLWNRALYRSAKSALTRLVQRQKKIIHETSRNESHLLCVAACSFVDRFVWCPNLICFDLGKAFASGY